MLHPHLRARPFPYGRLLTTVNEQGRQVAWESLSLRLALPCMSESCLVTDAVQ